MSTVAKLLPGSGVIVVDNPHAQSMGPLQVVTCNGNRDVLFWGEHISVNDSPTCQVRITNKDTVPRTLHLTGTLSGNQVPYANRPDPQAIARITWDQEGTVLAPGASVDANIRLSFTHPAFIGQDYPFVTKILITGTG